MSGLIHIYCGDGKGKTTAAIGLSIRAAGAGKKVLFTQFFKDGSSSEIDVLRSVPNVTVCHWQTVKGFYKNMDEVQRQQVSNDYSALLDHVIALSAEADLLVLDEAVSACNYGVICEERLRSFLLNKPESLEVVITGRNPSEKLLLLADYVTEMKKIKHPFDVGIKGRKGIEF